MAAGLVHHAKASHKGRKYRRNYRVGGKDMGISRYRARHGIAASAERSGHRRKAAPDSGLGSGKRA